MNNPILDMKFGLKNPEIAKDFEEYVPKEGIVQQVYLNCDPTTQNPYMVKKVIMQVENQENKN